MTVFMGFCEGAAGALRNLERVRRKQCAVYVEEQDFFIVHKVSFKMGFLLRCYCYQCQ